MEILDGAQHVFAKTKLVGERRVRFKNTTLNTSAQMFSKIAIDFGIDFTNNAAGIDTNTCVAG